jgi:hypothetical protein
MPFMVSLCTPQKALQFFDVPIPSIHGSMDVAHPAHNNACDDA